MIYTDRFPYWIEKLPQGGYFCRFPDFPEFVPEGASIAMLLEDLQEGFLPVLENRLKTGNLPEPRPKRAGEEELVLSPTYAAKLQLILAARERKISAAELGRRLGCLSQEATRIMKFSHPTKIDTLRDAVRAIGGELTVQVRFDD